MRDTNKMTKKGSDSRTQETTSVQNAHNAQQHTLSIRKHEQPKKNPTFQTPQ